MLRDATIYAEQGSGPSLNLLMQPEQVGARWCATVHWSKGGRPHLPDDANVSGAYTAAARVERGAWIVDCPCGGAQYACRTDRRLFCPDCLNEHAQGSWVLVEWPTDLDVVEALLEVRPRELNRNWYPHETVADLRAENLENGWVL